MEIYRDLELPDDSENPVFSAVALGLFDGVHLGHRKVIETAALYRGRMKITVLTFTMEHHRPRKKSKHKDILSIDSRLKRMEQLPVDRVVVPDFDRIRSLSPAQFVQEILIDKLHAKVVCCGQDYRFGKDAAGNVELLEQLCKPAGVRVIIVPPKMDQKQPVSSTRIRSCLLEGDIPTVNRLLGYPYFVEGEVIYGKQLGRTIRCPTINQALSEQLCLPRFGVYISTTCVDGVEYPSITNIGRKPTIEGERTPLAETHVIGINRFMYGEVLRVSLYKFIRKEEKFNSIAELSHYIQKDIQTARIYFKDQKGVT